MLHSLSELGVWGACPSGGSLKSWSARCGFQTLPSSGRIWELWVSFWLYVAVPGVEFMARVCLKLSCQFWCGYFLVWPIVGVTQLVSRFLSERIALCVTVDLVCLWKELNSGALYVIILNQNALLISFSPFLFFVCASQFLIVGF